MLSAMFLAGAVFADEYDTLAKKLSKGVEKLPSKKIAVMSFPHHDGGISSGSLAVSERLTTRLAGIKGVKVIERSLLDKVLSEMKLETSGVIDSETSKKLGKVLGVDAIVTGTLIDLKDNKTEVNARMINTETGEILSAAVEKIERTWQDRPTRMARKPEMQGVPVNPMQKPGQQQPPQQMPQGQGQPVPEGQSRGGEQDITGQDADGSLLAISREETDELRGIQPMPPFEMIKHSKQLAKERKFARALAYAKQGFRMAENRAVKANALFTIGRIHEELGNQKRAVVSYRALIKKFPGQSDIVEKAKDRLRTMNR